MWEGGPLWGSRAVGENRGGKALRGPECLGDPPPPSSPAGTASSLKQPKPTSPYTDPLPSPFCFQAQGLDSRGSSQTVNFLEGLEK